MTSVRPGPEVTAPQTKFVRSLQRQLHLSNALLDALAIRTSGVVFARCDRRQASALIEALVAIREAGSIPRELQRLAGQMEFC